MSKKKTKPFVPSVYDADWKVCDAVFVQPGGTQFILTDLERQSFEQTTINVAIVVTMRRKREFYGNYDEALGVLTKLGWKIEPRNQRKEKAGYACSATRSAQDGESLPGE